MNEALSASRDPSRPAGRVLTVIGRAAAAGLFFGMLAGASPEPSGSAEERTRAALARIETLDPRLNAVIAVEPKALEHARELDRAAAARKQPLFGIPILVKDNIETAGSLPTTAGSLALAGNVAGKDAPLVSRLRNAGAVILGKSNLSEWANFRSKHSISGWSAIGGQTRNPHALDRNACGSSSGSAVAVAVGMVTVAIGTETDGSITCPAAMTGVVGLKPTVGLVSRSGIVPLSASQDTAGPMARTVRRAAEILTVIAGSDPGDPATAEADRRRTDFARALDPAALNGTRIGVLRFATGHAPAADALFEQALEVLRARGAVLVDLNRAPDRARISELEYRLLLSEFRAGIDKYLAAAPPQVTVRSLAQLIAFNEQHAAAEMPYFGQDILIEASRAPGLDDPGYVAAREEARRLAGPDGIDRMLAETRTVALVAPTTAPAFLIDIVNGDQSSGGGAGSLAAVAGYPHLTVPMGAVRGLPVGLSFIGPAWSEALLLALGHAYEQAADVRIEPGLRPTVPNRPDR